MRLDFCALCGAKDPAALEHHHYKPKALGGDDDDRNLLTLCGECHGMVHDIPRPMRLGILVKAGRDKAEERCASEWRAIADRSERRAERAAEAARLADMARAGAERAELRAEMPIKCRARDCNNLIDPQPTGRRKAACPIRSHRRNETPKPATGDPVVRPADLNAPRAISAKTASFVTSKIKDLATPKNMVSGRISGRGIVGPKCAIKGAVINVRDWEEVVISDGVRSYVSRITKPALRG